MLKASFFKSMLRKNGYAPLRAALFFICALQLAVWPLAAAAQDVMINIDYNQIISDGELLEYQSMNESDIQNFLQAKQSPLASFYTTLDTGETVTASRIIYRASQNFFINPKFLLVLVQKEQSLIEDPSPNQNQFDWAAGYSCLDGQPCSDRWRGFAKQIASASEQFRYYYDHIGEYNFQPGKTAIIDGQVVTPRNTVTAALYNYTPHLHGNALFKTIWQRYFATPYPDGTLLRAQGEQGVWLLSNGMKRAFTSWTALVSRYNPDLIVIVDKSKIDPIPQGQNIRFAAYSLLRNKDTKDVYLLTIDQKRLITSDQVFKQIGFNPDEIADATDIELAMIPDGKPVTFDDAYPTGALLQDKKSGELYYVEGARKYQIFSKDIAAINYPGLKITKTTGATLDQYPTGFPVLLKDGILVKGSKPDIYVISNQQKRLIPTEKVFTAIGYKWKSVVVTSDDVLALHPTGEPIIAQ